MELLSIGVRMTKYDVAERAVCAQRTAQRMLDAMHKEGIVRIIGWERRNGGAIPRYTLQDGKKDAPRPRPLTAVEASRRYRNKDGMADVLAFRQRQKRFTNRVVRGEIRLGVWGL